MPHVERIIIIFFFLKKQTNGTNPVILYKHKEPSNAEHVAGQRGAVPVHKVHAPSCCVALTSRESTREEKQERVFR